MSIKKNNNTKKCHMLNQITESSKPGGLLPNKDHYLRFQS